MVVSLLVGLDIKEHKLEGKTTAKPIWSLVHLILLLVEWWTMNLPGWWWWW